MVQFGKTENTTNNTTNLDDKSKHNTAYVLDKTSQQFINVKDIITVTNVYRNMDVTIMACTIALSIAAPLINGLIQKAINKWNDEVPQGMQEEANQEMRLIKSKLAKLSDSTAAVIDVTEVKSESVTARDFLKVQRITNAALMRFTDKATKEIIEGFCKGDKPRVDRGELQLMRLHEVFGTSIESSMENDHKTLSIGMFKYDQALECLQRIIPSSKVCTSTTYMVRNMVTVIHMNLSQHEVKEITDKLSELYFVKTVKENSATYTVQLIPKKREVTVHLLSDVYGMDLTLISNAHFFSMKYRLPWYLNQDPNLSIESIMEMKLGHSISVLGEVVDEISAHATTILQENNPHDDLQTLFLTADKGPFKGKVTMRNFSNPLSLFNMTEDDDLLRLDKNFKTMSALIRVVGTIKMLYPTLIRKGDRMTEEYIARSRRATDMTYKPYVMPSAPDTNFEFSEDGKSTNGNDSIMMSGRVTPDVPKKLYPAIEGSIHDCTNGLCSLLKSIGGKDLLSNQICCVDCMPDDELRKVRERFSGTVFSIIQSQNQVTPKEYYIRALNIDLVNDILEGKEVKESYTYAGSMWYVRGSKLFSKNSKFKGYRYVVPK
jgi:hypothetical protein